jgi:hypothetical protein
MGLLRRLQKRDVRQDTGKSYSELELAITGASLPSGTATSAAFAQGLGKEVATASDAGGATVTVTFNEELPGTPIVKAFRCNSTVTADVTSLTASELVYTSSSADADVFITLKVPNTTEA